MQVITYLSCILIFAAAQKGYGQAQSAHKPLEMLFAGKWIDKKTDRCLEISFTDGYAIISDWNSKFQKKESGDIYKATLKNGKLIMPEDTQHRAPYSEILYKNSTLIYLTKSFAPAKKSAWDTQIFSRFYSKSQ